VPKTPRRSRGKAARRMAPSVDTSSLQVNVFDGTRKPFPTGRTVGYRIIDGNQQQIMVTQKKTASVLFKDLPFYDNFGDNYTGIVWSDGYAQAGLTPVKLSPATPSSLDLMLIPKPARFDFANAGWDRIKGDLPFLRGDVTDAQAQTRYESLLKDRQSSAAGLLNITTAMSQIFLPLGNPLKYWKRLKWDDSLAQDRFFAYCDATLIDQVRLAAAQGEFEPEMNPAFFHPGATASWKQVQFGEANVQLTFHEGDRQTIDGVDCILVEPDIDYFKDLLSHALLEVIPSAISGGLSNPTTVYVLRWIAGRHAGVPEFNPPFTIVS
jgi:hypothetical protein